MSGWIFEHKVFCGIVRVVREWAYYAGPRSPTRFKLFSSDKSKSDNAGMVADATLCSLLLFLLVYMKSCVSCLKTVLSNGYFHFRFLVKICGQN